MLAAFASRRAAAAVGKGTASGGTPPPAADAAPGSAGPPAPVQEASFLVLQLREATNLAALDYETHSSDPFVRVTLGALASKKTRAIPRNVHPMWMQRLVFPVDGLSDAEPLVLEIWDRDSFNAREFLGQVVMTLGKARAIAGDAGLAAAYWLALGKRCASDVVSGQLCVGFQLLQLTPQRYLQLAAELSSQLDPSELAARYSSKALHLQLRGINGLLASGLLPELTAVAAGGGSDSGDGNADGAQEPQQGQAAPRRPWGSLRVKFGRVLVEKPLFALPTEDAAATRPPSSCELDINEAVTLPLGEAMRAPALVARKRGELCDVKLYIKVGSHVVARTQIPFYDIAAASAAAASAAAASAAAASAAAASAAAASAAAAASVAASAAISAPALSLASLPGDALSCPSPPLSAHGARQQEQPAAGKWSGRPLRINACCSTLASLAGLASSMPCTPRSTEDADRPSQGAAEAGEPDGGAMVCRSKSDAAALLAANKHLTALAASGGLSSSSSCSNLSSLAAPGSPRGLLVEGSFGSVTACSRGGQASTPAGMSKRRVQGLAELDASSFKKALGGMLMPPREASRMGWVPTASAAEEEPAAGAAEPAAPSLCPGGTSAAPPSASYCRTMESAVLLAAPLQICLSLGVVERPVAVEAPCAAVRVSQPNGAEADEAGSEASEGSEAAGPASTACAVLPDPLGSVLQDVVLQGLPVDRLRALLLAPNSQLMAAHQAAQQLTEVVTGPWRPAPAPDAGFVRHRSVAYTKPLNMPLAPKACHVWEEHRLLFRARDAWAVEMECRNDAPKSDCYFAKVQLCGQVVPGGGSRLRVSMQLVWHRSTLGKNLVEMGAERDARRSWAALAAALRREAAASAQAAAKPDAPPAAGQAAPAACAEALGGGLGAAAPVGSWPRLAAPRAEVVAQLALVAALLLLSWVVASGANRAVAALHELAAAIDKAGTQPGLGAACYDFA